METNKTGPVFPHPLLPPHPPPPPPPPALSPDGLDSRISPSILLIIVILAVVFFVSGLLHLIVRYLLRPARRSPEDPDNLTALQGQLQQLFHLHDAGVDQSFIDSLPVFPYRAITGVKDPFDCAVCLCEFEAEDKLRLLPKCSHAFHLECIDTWLLSHSTCPLCRSSLLPDFPASFSPLVLVLDSGGESSREIAPDANAQLGPHVEEDPGQSTGDLPQKTGETGAKEAEPTAPEAPEPPARVVPVKLGKFRNVDGGVAGVGEGSCSNSSNGNLDERRCFSMGSFEYVMDESSRLHVAIKQPVGKHIARNPGHRPAMSECGCNSRREGHKAFSSARIGSNSQRRESLSISKIWLRSRSEKPSAREDGPRRVLSLRLHGLGMGAGDEAKLKCGSSRRTTASEPDGAWWVDKSGSELGLDVEAGGGGCNGTVASRVEETPSFARRTLLWLVGGRSPKVVNHS